MLHTVNKSPGESDKLETCLRYTQPGHSILLLENAVYAALNESEITDRLADTLSELQVYVLVPDLAARGLLGKNLNPDIRQVDYSGFVRLVAENAVVQCW